MKATLLLDSDKFRVLGFEFQNRHLTASVKGSLIQTE